MAELIISSFNVRGLKARGMYDLTQKWLIDVINNSDVACIQEVKTKNTSKINYIIQNNNLGYLFSPAVGHGAGGMLIIWKKDKIQPEILINNQKLQIIRYDNNIIANVYIHRDQYQDDYDELLEYVNRYSNDNKATVLVGDFNTITDLVNDRLPRHTDRYHDRTRQTKLLELKRNVNLKDAAVELNATEHTRKQNNTSSRIDLCLYKNIQPHIVKVIPNNVSDHSILRVTFKYTVNMENDYERGPGIFKLNNRILNDEIYMKEIQTRIKYAHINDDNFLLEYEQFKYDIRDRLREMCIESRKNQLKEKREILRCLSEIENRITLGEDLTNEKIQLETQLKLWEIDEAKMYVKALKNEYNEVCEGNAEKMKKYAQRYTQQANMNAIRMNSDDPNTLTNNIDKILEKTTDFYSKLYTSTPPHEHTQTELLNNFNKSIDEDDKVPLEREITVNEVKAAIARLSNQKSPGSDGLTSEYYKMFVNELAPILQKLYKKAYENHCLPYSLNEAIIKLLPKKNNAERIEDWRPISLINTDFKILAIIITQRLQPALSKIIGEDQTAHLKNRNAHTNISITRDLIDLANSKKETMAIISTDFEKAFDRVDRTFMHKLLKKIGIPQNIRDYITIIYHETTAKININGFITRSFTTNRGVRQGCPLSALLYILVLEVMLEMIRNDNTLQSPKIGNITYRLGAFADDVTIFLKNDTAMHLERIIIKFCIGTQFKLNPDKTKILIIGDRPFTHNFTQLTLSRYWV